MGGKLRDYFIGQMTNYFDAFGEQVSSEQETERRKICDECIYKGKVKPRNYLPLMDGCLVCDCPFVLKLRQKRFWRMKGKENKDLTGKEIAKLSVYKDTARSTLITIKCPHPDGNKWAKIDKHYL